MSEWKRLTPKPLETIAVALAIGSWIGSWENGSSAWLVPACLVTVALVRERPWARRLVRFLALVAVAAWSTSTRLGEPAAPAIGSDVPAPRTSGRWIATSRDGRLGRLSPVAAGAPSYELEGRPPRTGEALELLAFGRRRDAATGPASSTSLAPRIVVPADGWRSLEPRERGHPARLRAWIRGHTSRRLARLDEAAGSGGLLRSLVLGDARALDFETKDLFTRTGTRHLLAISGLHAGLLAFALGGFAVAAGSRTRRRRRAIALVTSLALFAWAWLTGTAPPLLRAALTLSIARAFVCLPDRASTLGPLERRADTRSLLALAFAVECLRDPRAIGSVSVQLSYVATASLLWFTRDWGLAIERLLPRASTAWSLLGAGPVERELRRLADRFTRALAQGFAASLVPSLATLPFVWVHFGEASWATLFATPLALPLVAFLLLGAFLGLAGVDEATILVRAASDALLELLQAFDALAGTPGLLPAAPVFLVAVVAWGWLAWPGLGSVARWLLALATGALAWFPTPSPQGLEVHALDVGAGTAIVLRTSEVEALIFDAGSRDRRGVWSAALAPLLRAWGVRRVHLVLSHEHRDHHGAFPMIASRVRVASFGGPCPPELAVELPDDATRWDGDGARTTVGDLSLELVRASEAAGNEGSRSLIVEWRGERFLFSGDAEADGLERALSSGALDGPFRLVTLPHHGSESRWLGRFLATTRPERVWISGSGEAPVSPEMDRRGLDWDSTGRSGPLFHVSNAPEGRFSVR